MTVQIIRKWHEINRIEIKNPEAMLRWLIVNLPRIVIEFELYDNTITKNIFLRTYDEDKYDIQSIVEAIQAAMKEDPLR